jgi:hypothetical protein
MRPPRPYPVTEVSAGLRVVNGKLDVFAPAFSELIDLEEELSRVELGQVPPGGEGDFASTLFGLSAVVSHVLGVYQDFYGGEAFLATARTEQSLVRHGRRVGYTTDPGVAATGAVAINVKTGLSGRLPEGIELLSLPQGEQKTEDYQTLDARNVDAKWNAIEPDARTLPIDVIPDGATSLEVVGLGLDLGPGEQILLVEVDPITGLQTKATPLVHTLVAVSENTALGTTKLDLDQPISDETTPVSVWRVLAKPALDLRLFGWDADPQVFPPSALRSALGFSHSEEVDEKTGVETSKGDVSVTVFAPTYGYEAHIDDTVGDVEEDHYLAEALESKIEGTWILKVEGDAAPLPHFVLLQRPASVSFIREERQDTVITVPDNPKTKPDEAVTSSSTAFAKTWISASTTALQVISAPVHPTEGSSKHPSKRSFHDIRSHWIAGFELSLSLVDETPNTNPVVEGQALSLEGDLTGLEPGMLAVLTTRDGSVAQLIELTGVAVSPSVPDVEPTTTIVWKQRGATPDHTFTMNDTLVLGNVVRVSHGKAKDEVLGDSDGVTPFLRFALKKSPVTHLPDARGAVPELEVRASDVLWQRVDDFSDSGPEDRHYILQRDEEQVTQVLFGDGKKGAIPPAGRRNIRAEYRHKLGRIGNVEAGRLSRLGKAHPLIATVRNPVPVAGGTEPASLNQIRVESTKFIRTFDRAVSAPDYADLALLFPGVARSRATANPSTGVVLTVADADGQALVDMEPFRAFLDARRDRGIPLAFKDPEQAKIVVSVRVEFDPAFFEFQIERGIREALTSTSETAPGLFAFRRRAFGQPAFLSQVYEAVNDVEGVTFSEILVFDVLPDTDGDSEADQTVSEVRDAIAIASHEWVYLDPANLTINTGKGNA